MNLDLYLFNFINGYAKKSKLLDFLGIFFAKYLGYFLIVWLFVFAYIQHKTMQIFLVPMIAGAISILVINGIVYFFYVRKRPVELIPDKMLISEPVSPAFPSDHTSFFLALSFTLFLYSFPLAIIFTLFSLLIAVSRIFCGVHWPSDILGGICSAFASFAIVYLVRIMLFV